MADTRPGQCTPPPSEFERSQWDDFDRRAAAFAEQQRQQQRPGTPRPHGEDMPKDMQDQLHQIMTLGIERVKKDCARELALQAEKHKVAILEATLAWEREKQAMAQGWQAEKDAATREWTSEKHALQHENHMLQHEIQLLRRKTEEQQPGA